MIADPEFCEAIVQTLVDGRRTRERLADIAARFGCTPTFVANIAESMTPPIRIYESAPADAQTKGITTMSTTTQRAQALARILKAFPGETGIKKVAATFQIDEALVRKHANGITEAATTSTTAPGLTARDLHIARRAEQFAAAVNDAEAKPITQASTTDLWNLAAAYYNG